MDDPRRMDTLPDEAFHRHASAFLPMPTQQLTHHRRSIDDGGGGSPPAAGTLTPRSNTEFHGPQQQQQRFFPPSRHSSTSNESRKQTSAQIPSSNHYDQSGIMQVRTFRLREHSHGGGKEDEEEDDDDDFSIPAPLTPLPASREDILSSYGGGGGERDGSGDQGDGTVGVGREGMGGGGKTGRSTFGTKPINLSKSREELESQPKINFEEKNRPLHGSFFKGSSLGIKSATLNEMFRFSSMRHHQHQDATSSPLKGDSKDGHRRESIYIALGILILLFLAIIAAAAVIVVFKQDKVAEDVINMAVDVQGLRREFIAVIMVEKMRDGGSAAEAEMVEAVDSKEKAAAAAAEAATAATAKQKETETIMKEWTATLKALQKTLVPQKKKEERELREMPMPKKSGLKRKLKKQHLLDKETEKDAVNEAVPSPHLRHDHQHHHLHPSSSDPSLSTTIEDLSESAKTTNEILRRMDDHLGYLNVRLGNHKVIFESIRGMAESIERKVEAATEKTSRATDEVKRSVENFRASFEKEAAKVGGDEPEAEANGAKKSVDVVDDGRDGLERNAAVLEKWSTNFDDDDGDGIEDRRMMSDEAALTRNEERTRLGVSSGDGTSNGDSTSGNRGEEDRIWKVAMLETMEDVRNATLRIERGIVDILENGVGKNETLIVEMREKFIQRGKIMKDIEIACSRWKPLSLKSRYGCYFWPRDIPYDFTYSEAEQFCQDFGGNVINVDSEKKMETVIKLLGGISITDESWSGSFWLGLEKTDSTWKWAPSMNPLVYSKWNSDSILDSTHSCAFFTGSNIFSYRGYTLKPTTWETSDCAASRKPICQIELPRNLYGVDPSVDDYVSHEKCLNLDVKVDEGEEDEKFCMRFVRLQKNYESAKDFCARRYQLSLGPAEIFQDPKIVAEVVKLTNVRDVRDMDQLPRWWIGSNRTNDCEVGKFTIQNTPEKVTFSVVKEGRNCQQVHWFLCHGKKVKKTELEDYIE